MMWAKNILCWYAVLTMFSIAASAASSEACQIQISRSHELQHETFSLADLLPRETCPSLLTAAEKVSMGKVPPMGVKRVLDGAEVRERLHSLDMSQTGFRIKTSQVPERILVTRSASERSCADIAQELLPASRLNDLEKPVDCGVGAINGHAHLELVKKTWDPSSRAWEFVVRCAVASDCVPFFIRVPTEDQHGEVASAFLERHPLNGPSVHVGEKIKVVWDDNGLHLVLPGAAIDAGRSGDSIRVRLKAGRIVSANITSSGVVFSH